MSETITAIYEHGVLRPLRPLPLPENARVHIQILDESTGTEERMRVYQVLTDAGVIGAAESPASVLSVSESELDRIGRSLAQGGPLSDSIIAERDSR